MHWRGGLVVVALVLGLAGPAAAQRGWRGRTPLRDPAITWTLDPEFRADAFCFARIIFDTSDRDAYGGWRNDYPDGDWNFSFRLQQLTSMKVDPDPVALRWTDPRLAQHPFVYMANVNRMVLSTAEVAAMRRYLLNGGFVMADDFWSAASWRHVRAQMAKVFPDRQPRELSLDHPIFHLVYELDVLPQVPSHDVWRNGWTFEYQHGDPEGDEAPHFQAWLNDRGDVMALFCHNNDIGDGWEREGTNAEYFSRYSEKLSYPLGINIVTYALTH